MLSNKNLVDAALGRIKPDCRRSEWELRDELRDKIYEILLEEEEARERRLSHNGTGANDGR